MSAMPYLAMYLLSFPIGFLSDYILKKNWLSITACRKLSNSIGKLILIILTLSTCRSVCVFETQYLESILGSIL